MNPTTRNPFTAVFAAIVAFCKLLVRGSGVMEDVVSMGEATVKVARKKLVIDLAIEEQNYATKAVNRAALQQVKEQEAMDEYVAGDSKKQQQLEHAKSVIKKLVEDNLANMNQKEEE